MSVWLLALLDDIAMLIDDTAVVAKISMQKTAWILWDDLAVNAEKASWFHSSRELPILWKITKGALKNKIIILPFAFILMFFAPFLIWPILILGWIYLAYEGAEKIHEFILEKVFNKNHSEVVIWISEEKKIKSAVFTDFILSVEIIIMALSTVLEYNFLIQVLVVSLVAIIATFWVYWIVALIVRIDDAWLFLIKKCKTSLWKTIWKWLVFSLPYIIKILSIVWTLAMLLVAGSIFTHNIELFHYIYEHNFSFLYAFMFDMILWFIVWYIVFLILHYLILPLFSKTNH